MVYNIYIHNVLARTIGHKGIIAPLEQWVKLKSYSNNLFIASYDNENNAIQFQTILTDSPFLLLAQKYLKNGIKFSIKLEEKEDGRYELNMLKGNLPARWALMLYEFGFDKHHNEDDINIVSYVTAEFDIKCLDMKYAYDIIYNVRDNSIKENIKSIIDINSNSPIEINYLISDPTGTTDLTSFIKHYKQPNIGYLHIVKGPHVNPDKIKTIKHFERRIMFDGNNIEEGCNVWNPANLCSSISTKVFTNECVSISNNNKLYHCDIGCCQGSLGFPISSYFIANHILFSENNSYLGEYDFENNYHVRDAIQKEDLIVLQENINKMGGAAKFMNVIRII
jgi:hypothetical protein